MATIEDMLLQHEVEQFLYREADLLDRQQYKDWLAMLADEMTYLVPSVESVERRHRSSNRVGEAGETAFFEDTRKTLEMRVARLKYPGAWAEVPPSRTKHYITNIIAERLDETRISVKSNFMIFRSRLESEEDQYFGAREDIIIRVGGGLFLSSRKVVLAQSVMTARSITTFF